MATNETQLRELGYHVANISVMHKHLFGFLSSENEAGVHAFISDNLKDVQYRCRRIHNLLTDISSNNPQEHKKIVGAGAMAFVLHSLFLSSLTKISEDPCSPETLEHLKYRNFIEAIAALGLALPSSAFDMFDNETQDWIQSYLKSWKKK